MAMYDIIGEMSDAQVLTVDAQSTNVLDLTNSDVNWGNAEIWLNVVIGTQPETGTSINFTLYTHSAATSINSGTAMITSGAIAQATMVDGYQVIRQRLPLDVDRERYIGMYYDITDTFDGGGTVDAWLDFGSESDFGTQKTLSNIS